MSVSYIPLSTKQILWGKAAGRCQYRGCPKNLFLDALTQGEFNQSYIAHIVADSPNGPRGDKIRSHLLKDKIYNLMLLCDTHHRLIDKGDIDGHPESLLLEMKKEQEDRIDLVASIVPYMQSHIVVYRANVGKHTPQVTYESIREYLLPERYPAQSFVVDLSLTNSPQRDLNNVFWQTELENLETQFGEQLRPKLRKNEIAHLSLFAIAPIPLLIKLGSLFNDIQNVEVHQLVRNPKTWKLSSDHHKMDYIVSKPRIMHQTVALNFSLSATIANKRITNVLGDDTSIYSISIASPSNDFLKNKSHLQDFSMAVRLLLNEIKATYGDEVDLNIFPAMPLSAAIEFGRIWMPKADLPLIIYDQNSALGGFIKAMELRNKV